jgi:hypothetical protein
MESLEEKYLEAIRALKSELRQLLGPEEAKRLNRRLGRYLRWARSPARRERALTRALAAIREHPRVRDRFGEILKEVLGPEGVEALEQKPPFPHYLDYSSVWKSPLVQLLRALGREFEPLPGEGGEIPPGTVMVCPVDPGHYRRRLQFRGQRLRCPEHEVDLVPEERSGD